MRKNKGVFLIAMVLFSFTFIGCSDTFKEESVTASIYEVRITNVVQPKAKGDPAGGAIAGAIVGGLVFDAPTIGAIVGAAGESQEVLYIVGLAGCKFFADTNGQKISFTFTGDYSATRKCSLLRHNDKVRIIKRELRGQLKYILEEEEKNNAFPTQGEVVPQ